MISAADARSRLVTILDGYLGNEISFWPFWEEFSDLILIVVDDECEPPFDSRCDDLEAMYEAVYMGQPGEESGPHGLLGEPELKRELSRLRHSVGL